MDFEFGGVRVQAGGRGLARLPVCTMASGHELTLDVHILNGRRPGPAIGIVAGTHGEEVFSTELLRQAFIRLQGEDLAGTVLIMPLGNPPTFEWGVRHTPNDGFNLNRIFPGNKDGWLTDRLAHVIATQFAPRCEILLDTHGGAGDTHISYAYTKPPTTDYNRRVHELAMLLEAEVLWEAESVAPGSLNEYVEKQGVLAVVQEVGGGPALNAEWLDCGLRGIWNVLKAVGTLSGTPEVRIKARQVVRRALALRPSHGGLFIPEVDAGLLGKRVSQGTLLGRVISASTFAELDRITAPFTGDLMMIRSRVSKVHAGDYSYFLGDPASGYTLPQ